MPLVQVRNGLELSRLMPAPIVGSVLRASMMTLLPLLHRRHHKGASQHVKRDEWGRAMCQQHAFLSNQMIGLRHGKIQSVTEQHCQHGVKYGKNNYLILD